MFVFKNFVIFYALYSNNHNIMTHVWEEKSQKVTTDRRTARSGAKKFSVTVYGYDDL